MPGIVLITTELYRGLQLLIWDYVDSLAGSVVQCGCSAARPPGVENVLSESEPFGLW